MTEELTIAKSDFEAAVASEYLAAYRKSLKDKSKVNVNEKLLLDKSTN